MKNVLFDGPPRGGSESGGTSSDSSAIHLGSPSSPPIGHEHSMPLTQSDSPLPFYDAGPSGVSPMGMDGRKSSMVHMQDDVGEWPGGLSGEDEERPILEEIGINPEEILKRTLVVLNPFSTIDKHIMDDADFAGPLLFCFLLGFGLLLRGKVHFGYIYGVGSLGCIGIYVLLNLMSQAEIKLFKTASVLGYCLLPMVFLVLFSLVLPSGYSCHMHISTHAHQHICTLIQSFSHSAHSIHFT
eukprot:TRINITY_DN1576_c0_g1_i2.p1 TRINITY_DN1576_c0_g1~~TRINITY_DN1576_c0_g1_i2.p1  ORF type:complete len:241 (-),score=53.24 TRINITY_DN1576_c0_g1_i2:285-1007(-)